MLHQDTKFTRGLKVFFILLPLFLTTAWLISVAKNKVTVTTTDHGLKLSPYQNTRPIIIGLLLFQAGYITFIFMMFQGEIREFFQSRAKKATRQNK